jgi:hypothetical protein
MMAVPIKEKGERISVPFSCAAKEHIAPMHSLADEDN